MNKFIVFSVDHQQRSECVDFVLAEHPDEALNLVLDHREYCSHGVVCSTALVRWMAEECERVLNDSRRVVLNDTYF